MTKTPEEIAARLNEAQRKALIAVAFLLDTMAGEGLGTEVEMQDGTTSAVFADDVIEQLCQCFGITMAMDTAAPLGLAVRAHLTKEPRHD